MAQIALGNVTSASTVNAVQATVNAPANKQSYYSCQAIQFQALGSNTGSVYIVAKQTPSLTADVFMEIVPPSTNPTTRPSWSVGNPSGPNTLNVAEYWILPQNANEGVRVTIIIT